MIRDLNKRERVDIFKDDAGTRRVLLGKGSNGFYGLKVSPEGVDVYTATDDQLIFNSDQNVFKIDTILTGSIAVDFALAAGPGADAGFSQTSTNSLVLPHGLSHIPVVSIFMYDSTAYVPVTNGGLLKSVGFSTTNPLVAFQAATVGSMATAYWDVNVDATNVTISGRRSGFQRAGVGVGAQTYPSAALKVYCLQETAN